MQAWRRSTITKEHNEQLHSSPLTWIISQPLGWLIGKNDLPPRWAPKFDPKIIVAERTCVCNCPVSFTWAVWLSSILKYIYGTMRKNKVPVWPVWPYILSIFYLHNLRLPIFTLFSHSAIQIFWRVFFPAFLHHNQSLNVMDKQPCRYFPFHLKMQMAEWKLYQACQRQENNWLISLWPSEDWFCGNAIISH